MFTLTTLTCKHSHGKKKNEMKDLWLEFTSPN